MLYVYSSPLPPFVFQRLPYPSHDQSVLLPSTITSDEDEDNESFIPESISISRIDDLLAQMRFHEVPKRAQFSIGMELGAGWVIGVKGCVSFFPYPVFCLGIPTPISTYFPTRG